jgi:hypothetical protein
VIFKRDNLILRSEFERLFQKGIGKYIRIFRIQENMRIRIRIFSTCNWFFENVFEYFKKGIRIFLKYSKSSKKIFESFE